MVLEPRNIYVSLPGDVADALIRVAMHEWRHPKEQAGSSSPTACVVWANSRPMTS